jgi:hypothetical protein
MRRSLSKLWPAMLPVAALAPNLALAGPPAAGGQYKLPIETIWQFGEREKLCARWTDGCRICLRSAGGVVSCSNVGIACLPEQLRCTSRLSGTK